MAIVVDKDTRLVVQGLTGSEGRFHGLRNRNYGTNVVAGVTPGKGGADVEGIPVFNTVAEAVAEAGANTTLIFVPARFAVDAVYEAVDAGIGTVICITEHIPAHDMLRVYTYIRPLGITLVGPNCPGVLSPGKANVGIIPAEIFSEGNVGLVSRSGTLTYQIGHELTQLGLGNSTIVGIGGDPVVGSSFIDILEKFEADPETEYVVLVGEIGGNEEEKAAAFIEERMTKPVFAYIAGFSAPPGKTMGHAGAIISGTSGTAPAKKEALEAVGVVVGTTPTEVAQLVAERIGVRGVISFARGVPAPECLPVDELAECARAVLLADGRTILSYGSPSGYEPLRDSIAERHGVDRERVLRDERRPPGLRLLRPALRRGRRARARRAADLRPSAEDPARARRRDRAAGDGRGGPRPDALEAALAEGPKPAFLYTIPTFQNPSGRTLSADRRRADRRDRPRSRPARARGRSLRAGALRGRAATVAPRARGRGARRLHLVVLEDGGARAPRRLLRSPARVARRARGYICIHLHHARPPRDRQRSTSSSGAAISTRIWHGFATCFAPAATRCSKRSSASSAGPARLVAPTGRLLRLARRAGRRRRRAARPVDRRRRHVRCRAGLRRRSARPRAWRTASSRRTRSARACRG